MSDEACTCEQIFSLPWVHELQMCPAHMELIWADQNRLINKRDNDLMIEDDSGAN